MIRLNITKKLFWVLSFVIVIANLVVTIYLYKQTNSLVETRAFSRAQTLHNYFVSMRNVYHNQFLYSGLEINDDTIGFLPAHAASKISDKFEALVNDGTSIRNVSDNPRNINNIADSFELEAIDFFKNNQNQEYLHKMIIEDGKQVFFFASPLKMQSYCMLCHGKKDDVLPYVAQKYDLGYDYEIGDIRGITSIKIPIKKLDQQTLAIFWKNVFVGWVVMFGLLFIIYFMIKKFTQKEVQAKEFLEFEVQRKTADLMDANNQLMKSNEKQQHLFDVLRTVADCNQILITTKTIDDMINKTAHTMHKNSSFSGVKIMIVENGVLKVKISLGLDEEYDIYPLEKSVFETNKEILLKSFDDNLPKECLEKIQKYNITEVYCIPLVSDSFANKALGVLSICTNMKFGLSTEEEAMIKELAGDLGFAINSYIQKDMIEKLSYYDPLTNLPNKNYLLEYLPKSIMQNMNLVQYGSLLYVNIDDFKTINDAKGIAQGDLVLKSITDRLMKLSYKHLSVYRIGGDEFAIVLDEIGNSSNGVANFSMEVAQSILDVMEEPFMVDEQKFYLAVSIGIVLYNNHDLSVYELLNSAESAMKLSKSNGKNKISFFDHDLQEIAVSRSIMMHNLKDAYERNEFFVLYQKQLDYNTKVVGVEALIRWQHPTIGIVSPIVFIPLAEESGLIIDIGNFVIRESLSIVKSWENDTNKKDWRVSINVSPVQFKSEKFFSYLYENIEKFDVSPSKIRLELTEGILINNEDVTNKLKYLKEKGFSISVDDFGTGYSSLSYLKNLPIDELKIDQSFVANLGDNKADKTIIETIISMGRAFDLEVLAEGVETKEQFEILQKMGCGLYQGYLFAKPDYGEKL